MKLVAGILIFLVLCGALALLVKLLLAAIGTAIAIILLFLAFAWILEGQKS